MRISLNTSRLSKARNLPKIDFKIFGHIIDTAIIKKVKDDSKVVPVKVYITNEHNHYYILDKNGECLGSTTLHICNPNSSGEYSPGAVYVENMESFYDNYLGAGSLLHEIAVVISKNAGFEGRVILDAEKSSHIFHYKFGFRALGEKPWLLDEAIEREIGRAERKIQRGIIQSTKEHDTEHLGSIPMYLPEETANEILKRTSLKAIRIRDGL